MNLNTRPYFEPRLSAGPAHELPQISYLERIQRPVILFSLTYLPNINHIDRHHFALTYNKFDDECRYRLIVQGLVSTRGTIVTYNNSKGRKLRSGLDWIIGGFRIPCPTERVDY